MKVQSPVTEQMVQTACEVYGEIYVDDDKDMGDAMRAALEAVLGVAQSPSPPETLWGQIAAIYEGMDAEDTARIDREWVKMRSIGRVPSTEPPTQQQSSAIRDIGAERHRQIEKEGWTHAHDDTHVQGEIAIAAACYVTAPSMMCIEREWAPPDTPKNWPWHFSWWKPSFRRQNLVKAAALIVAEIERLDRAYFDL